MDESVTIHTKNGSELSFRDYKNIFINYIMCFLFGMAVGATFL